MTDILKKIKNVLFEENLDIQHKLLNLILSTAAVGGSSSLIVCLIIGVDWMSNLVVALVLAVVSIALYLSVVKKRQRAAAMLITIVTNTILFPIMYIYTGGMNSGMPIWFVLGLIFSWLILKGVTCYVVYSMNVIAMSVAIYMGYRYPHIIHPLSAEAATWDVAQSIVIVSCIFGAIFKFQTYVYEKQRKHLLERDEMLRQAMDELKKANQAKSDFLASMSHEIRTPINAVLGMDEMILRENENEEIEQYALNIQNAGQTLLTLVNDILDFSKIESGKMEILPVGYDVFSLMNDCYNMIYMRASEKNLQLRIKNNPDMPMKLYGDEIRIRQIISNLLTNAVKYTKQGFIEMEVDWKPLEDEQILLLVHVRDSGMGISKENREELFDSFLRIEEKRNRNIEGTGLGLTITKRFIDLMQGTIKVESELGQGSTFSVAIPQKVLSRQPVGEFYKKFEHRDSNKKKYKETFHAPEARLLVVDDVQMNLDVVKGLLKSTKMQMDFALSGKEALELVQQKAYHLIFMDHMMPEMDGVETLHKMQEIEHLNKQTPIIVLTANAIIGADEEYLAEGFSDYLSKPVRVDELEAMVQKYLPSELIIKEDEEAVVEEATDNQVTESRESVELPNQRSWLEQIDFLDIQTGLTYCAESEEFYKEMLKSYMAGDKRKILEQSYQTEDLENYRIQIHALKSTSLSIGATSLSEKALQLEQAAKEQNLAYIKENHSAVMAEYQGILEGLDHIL